MMRDVQSIPPAPRTVRWRAVLWYRWPLALGAFLLAIYGGAFTWMLWLESTGAPERQRQLREGNTSQAEATVTRVDRAVATFPDNGEPADRVSYVFLVKEAFAHTQRNGACFTGNNKCGVGDKVAVQFLPTQSAINCLVDGRLDLMPTWLRPDIWFLGLVVPGLLFFASWFTSVLLLRHVMIHGDVGVARVLVARPTRFVQPSMLRVTFQFRDHHAMERIGHHWVRLHSPLGQRLAAGPIVGAERLPVLHHRRWPRFSRLALPDDFEAGAAPPPLTNQEIAL